MKHLPTTIQLTSAEQHELAVRSYVPYGREPTIASFWRNLLAARGILPTARTLPVTVPTGTAGEFRIEWHSRALGPEAIAQGIAFRRYAESKDEKFNARLQRQGRETPANHWR